MENTAHSKISVIVPVYKCERFIVDCVDCISNQTYTDLEIILVDDGSTDNSGKICDELASKDSRIKVVHKENGGVSSARNAGLDTATGDYVMFVDSDDLIHYDMCQYLLSLMNEECDFVVSGFYRSDTFSLDESKLREATCDFTSYSEIAPAFLDMFNRRILNCPYAKLFRKDIIGTQRFDTSITLGEDLLFNLEYLKKVSKGITVSTFCGYMYFVANANSITNNFRESNFDTAILLNKKLLEFASIYSLDSEIKDLINKVLVTDTMEYLQSLYFKKTSRLYKREMALTCLYNAELERCCRRKYNFSIQRKILFNLIKHKRERMINLFFKIKKLLKKNKC